MGNLRSVSKALEHVAGGKQIIVTADPAVVAAAERVVFPGQGAMPDCMRELDARGLRPAVLAAAKDKPFLGICIGLQMLFEHSEEGNVAGLGVFAGEVKRFPDARMVGVDGQRLKVPHMGWNCLQQKPHALWAKIADGARFYFVHSYCVQPADSSVVTGTAEYGIPFTCAVGRDNIFAVQFHPEKSAQDGLQLLKNFVEWRP
ncbi:imidazole glycerol phosphate synthase subunit HisH [Dechloromonas sp. A34]|uniref:imidazole glycerol phosphate synthase subunit HisH n=1 Tax=Dechloromonas sp. A34 TaxID=447588 RepID=UPI003A522827